MKKISTALIVILLLLAVPVASYVRYCSKSENFVQNQHIIAMSELIRRDAIKMGDFFFEMRNTNKKIILLSSYYTFIYPDGEQVKWVEQYNRKGLSCQMTTDQTSYILPVMVSLGEKSLNPYISASSAGMYSSDPIKALLVAEAYRKSLSEWRNSDEMTIFISARSEAAVQQTLAIKAAWVVQYIKGTQTLVVWIDPTTYQILAIPSEGLYPSGS